MGFKYASFEPFRNRLAARQLWFSGSNPSLKRACFCLKKALFCQIRVGETRDFTQTKVGLYPD